MSDATDRADELLAGITPGPWERRTAPLPGETKAEYLAGTCVDNDEPLQVLVSEVRRYHIDALLPKLAQALNARNAAESDLDAALATLREVREAHYEIVIYEYDDTNGVWVTDQDGERIVLARICAECSDEEIVESVEAIAWDTAGHGVDYPCRTIEILDRGQS